MCTEQEQWHLPAVPAGLTRDVMQNVALPSAKDLTAIAAARHSKPPREGTTWAQELHPAPEQPQ